MASTLAKLIECLISEIFEMLVRHHGHDGLIYYKQSKAGVRTASLSTALQSPARHTYTHEHTDLPAEHALARTRT